MDPEDDVRAYLTGAAGGAQPPMRLDAADVIERGGRVRRRRKRFAVAGTSAATAVVLAVAGFLAGHRAGPPEPLEPAGPGLSTIGTSSPAATPSPQVAPATSIAPPAAEPGRTSARATRAPQPPSAGRTPPRSVPTTSRPSSGPTETGTPPSATTSR
ncbi:hypothetical protein SAMN05421837_105428 [Amycolatopsis pretoriensis]|uniref:Uncharacterized protein n=1 Tax=Amycolatopsis pretoriensis TaxID=218821 RepID=A0A1H5QXH6_9PSEU|nr:hypothetical protein [Amycolatopsis pretoriensis]SEF30872.1 hypothetical protein SAMN05421837_105428 [Amycolatopsis pretoriensis]